MRLLSPLLLLLIITLFAPVISAQKTVNITAILSHDQQPYYQVLWGIKQFFIEHNQTINLQIITNIKNNRKDTREKILASKPSALLSLGQQATLFSIEHFKNLPICAGMLLNEKIIEDASNATALTLEFSLEIQIKWLKKMINDRGTIAILFNPQKNTQELIQFKKIAKQYSLPIHLLAIENNRNIPQLLNQLPRNIAAIWSFTNSAILNSQTAKPVLLYSFRQRIPIVGLSSQWVKAGALYALERDYVDIGKQCGEKILKLLQGVPPKSLSVKPPRKVRYVINRKTAKHMKIDLSAQIINNAYEIY